MSRNYLTLPLLGLAIWLIGQGNARGQSGGDANRPSDETVSALELVKNIIQEESAIDRVHTFYLRMLGKWTIPPEVIAARTENLKKTHPDSEVNPERFAELRPAIVQELEIAFDEKRIRKLQNWHDNYYDLRIWDGERMVSIDRPSNGERRSYHDRPLGLESANLFSDLSWLLLAPHSLEGHKDMIVHDIKRNYGLPDDYVMAGEADFHDHHCWVLENREALRRIYVGTQDRRLYGLVRLHIPSPLDDLEYEELRKKDEEFVRSGKSSGPAPPITAETFATAIPEIENYMEDYREISPGFWFPARP